MTNSTTYDGAVDDRLPKVREAAAARAAGPHARTIEQPTWTQAKTPNGPYRAIDGAWRPMRYGTASPSKSVRVVDVYDADPHYNPFSEELTA